MVVGKNKFLFFISSLIFLSACLENTKLTSENAGHPGNGECINSDCHGSGKVTATVYLESLGNAEFVASVLEDVFVEDDALAAANSSYLDEPPAKSSGLGIIRDYIYVNRNFFGGLCFRNQGIFGNCLIGTENNFYNDPNSSKYLYIFNKKDNNSYHELSVFGSENVGREGYRIQACNQLIEHSTALETALDHASVSFDPPAELSLKAVDRIYKLFYPIVENQAAVEKLHSMLLDLEGIDIWKKALQVVCHSPSWQKL